MTEMSVTAKLALKKIGNFGPTAHAANREVKGYTAWDSADGEPGKKYVNSTELRELAAGLIEAADWLDARAALGGPSTEGSTR